MPIVSAILHLYNSVVTQSISYKETLGNLQNALLYPGVTKQKDKPKTTGQGHFDH